MARTVVMVFHLNKHQLLNANDRMHWAAKADKVKVLRTLGFHATLIHEPLTRAHLVVRVGWPNKRRRDVDNITPTIKALVDGIITDGHLLPGDDDMHLIGPDKRPYLAGIPTTTVLHFTFTEVPS